MVPSQDCLVLKSMTSTAVLWPVASLSAVYSHLDICFPTSSAVGVPGFLWSQFVPCHPICLWQKHMQYLYDFWFSLGFTLHLKTILGGHPKKGCPPSQGTWFPPGPISFDLFFFKVFFNGCAIICYQKKLAVTGTYLHISWSALLIKLNR